MNNQQIESEIQAKSLTAPRVTKIWPLMGYALKQNLFDSVKTVA